MADSQRDPTPLAKVKDRQPSIIPELEKSQGLDSHEAMGTVAASQQSKSHQKRNSGYNTQSQPATILKKSLGAKGETINIQIDLAKSREELDNQSLPSQDMVMQS